MAKILKNLVFGQKKNPPAPPRPDYQGKVLKDEFADHNYENIPKFIPDGSKSIHFLEKKQDSLVVFENYSDPADLLCEDSSIFKTELDCDPVYMAPIDDVSHSDWATAEEEDMYCLPYEGLKPTLPSPCSAPGHSVSAAFAATHNDDSYDVVPNEEGSNDYENTRTGDDYDEPWEWTVGARLTSSLQVSPASPLEERTLSEGPTASTESLLSDDEEEEDEMSSRQRRLLYETAFDSRVRRDADDMDQLMQSPVLQSVTRAASRSSFGSTSGSSASSTPTHRFTPTERRKVTLVRDHHLQRSASPLSKEYRKLPQWDNVSRCSSEKSSSQESMNVVVVDPKEDFRNNCKNKQEDFDRIDNKSGSRDNLVFRDDRRTNLTANYPSNWKELSNARLENSNVNQKNATDIVFQKDGTIADQNSFISKNIPLHSGVKVLPTDNTHLIKPKSKVKPIVPESFQPTDSEHKENNSQALSEETRRKPSRPTNLLTEVRPLDNVPQSPDTDLRPSDDYDPPWDFKSSNVLRPSVNGSLSVPEKLSQQSSQGQLTSSVTHEKLEDQSDKNLPAAASKALPAKPTGLSRPNLNLNLNSDFPRKARQSLTLNFGCAALSAVGEKVDVELTLEKQGWYHGSISRLDAENLLRVLKEGSYLVRNSESSKQDYSLSLKSARGFMHMKIVHSDDRFILGQFSNPFSSIPEMIHHYSINKLPIKGAEHMSLLYPVIDQLL